MSIVTVIDSIMGSGKTSWAIQHLNESPANKRFIYITPYLDEVARIQRSVIGRQFIAPDNKNSEGKKLRSLKMLIVEGKDIASTHALFRTADEELIDLLTDAGYTLILDEVMDVIERAPIGSQDIRAALRSFAKIEENRIIWTDEEYVDDRFQDIKLLAKAGNLFYHRNQFLIWTFPPHVFKAFDDVIVMTYLFDAQIQRYYYDMHRITYEYRTVKVVEGRYELSTYDRKREGRRQVMELIDLHHGNLNDLGEIKGSFSVNWLRYADVNHLLQVKKNLYNYFRNICKGSQIAGNEGIREPAPFKPLLVVLFGCPHNVVSLRAGLRVQSLYEPVRAIILRGSRNYGKSGPARRLRPFTMDMAFTYSERGVD